MDKMLPSGCFIVLKHLPADATDASVAEWFQQYLPTITEDRVTVAESLEHDCKAMISLDNPAVARLMDWAFEGRIFPGGSEPIRCVAFTSRHHFA